MTSTIPAIAMTLRPIFNFLHKLIPPPAQLTIGRAFEYARDMDDWFIEEKEFPRMFDPYNLVHTVGL
jgi:hypothetical protein